MANSLSTPLSKAINRRQFFASSIGTSFLFSFPLHSLAATTTSEKKSAPEPQAFVKISEDGAITIQIKHIEFGQGTYTGLATLLAEELDADWNAVKCEHAPADTRHYINSTFGIQGTGGSSSIANSHIQMREAGAAMRTMLLSAAATVLKVNAAELTASKSVIHHRASNRSLPYGKVAKLAASMPVPNSINLKQRKDFSLIGKVAKRKDFGKADGSALYTQDVQLPNMLTAVVKRPPRFGSRLKSYDKQKALAIQGVEAVLPISNGLAIIAKDFWSAKTGRDSITVEWDESSAMQASSADLINQYKKLAGTAGITAAKQGDIESAFAQADQIIEADYQFPYLAHATMEPMNCVVQIQWDDAKAKPISAELTFGCQLQTLDQSAVAKLLDIDIAQVTINTLYAGGSFGRRGSITSDYVLEAVQIAKVLAKNTPIKLVWTREDDMQAGYFRPMYVHKLTAGVDKAGKIIAWRHRIIGQSVAQGSPLEFIIHNGVDITSVEGAVSLPYAIPNFQVELHSTKNQVPILFWRSVASTHTAYSVETFMDSIALKLGKDPIQYRKSLIAEDERYQTVIDRVVKDAKMTEKHINSDMFFGLAVHKSFNTYVAQVAKIRKSNAGFRLEAVYCAVDCGMAINPDIIRAQMEGGIAYGLSPALMSAITISKGAVEQNNFHNYRVLRHDQMPDIKVTIIDSDLDPTGVGEPATPVIAPAIANALLAAGQTLETELPFKSQFI